MLHALAPLAVLLVVVPPAEVKPGDKVYVSVPVRYAVAPIADDEAGLRELFGALKAGDLRAVHALGEARRFSLKLPDGPAEVLDVRDGASYPLRVPTARVELKKPDGGRDRFWIPVQFLRDKDAPLPRGEYRLPVFLVQPVSVDWLTADRAVTLYDYGPGGIIAARKLDDFTRYHKAEAAHNTATAQHLIRTGAVFYVENRTAGRVVDGRIERIGKRDTAVKVRVLDGPAADSDVWVAPECCQPNDPDAPGFLSTMTVVPWNKVKRSGR